jgi:hypothetical protein
MPEISRFYGIRICMYVGDHLPPHFHAEYGEDEAMIEIMTGAIHKGSLPTRAYRLVSEWLALHRPELEENWARAHSDRPLQKIAPL